MKDPSTSFIFSKTSHQSGRWDVFEKKIDVESKLLARPPIEIGGYKIDVVDIQS